MTYDDFHSTSKEILTHEDEDTKLWNLNLSTLYEILENKIYDQDMKQMNEVIFKNVKMKNLKFEREIEDEINFIEKEHEAIKIYRSKETNHIDIYSSLLKLAKIEESNDHDKLSTFCKIFCEKIRMAKKTCRKSLFLKIHLAFLVDTNCTIIAVFIMN